MSCCVLSITGLIRWTQNMLPMMRWTILTRWLRTLWPLLVGCSSCSHIPQGKEQVIVKSWTETCHVCVNVKCPVSVMSQTRSDEYRYEWWGDISAGILFPGPQTTLITHQLNGWNLPLLHRWWMGCGGNIQICTQRLLVLSSLLTLLLLILSPSTERCFPPRCSLMVKH